MTQEMKNERMAIGGDVNYLKFLTATYGPDAKVGDVIEAEKTRLIEGSAADISSRFEAIVTKK